VTHMLYADDLTLMAEEIKYLRRQWKTTPHINKGKEATLVPNKPPPPTGYEKD
jgi:hypothetical protein